MYIKLQLKVVFFLKNTFQETIFLISTYCRVMLVTTVSDGWLVN